MKEEVKLKIASLLVVMLVRVSLYVCIVDV